MPDREQENEVGVSLTPHESRMSTVNSMVTSVTSSNQKDAVMQYATQVGSKPRVLTIHDGVVRDLFVTRHAELTAGKCPCQTRTQQRLP